MADAVEEMDWITGQVLRSLREAGVEESTLVIWVADNGPTTSELQNGGTVGPFVGRWAANVIDTSCYVCPADYTHSPTADQPRRCTTSFPVPGTTEKFFSLDGIACSADVGLGSTWEANLRMPAFARWPGQIAGGELDYSTCRSTPLDLDSTFNRLDSTFALDLQARSRWSWSQCVLKNENENEDSSMILMIENEDSSVEK